MKQIGTTPGRQLARVGLWLVLVGLPLVFYLLMVGMDAISWFDIRGGVGVTLLVYGWPMLLTGLVAYGLLAAVAVAWKRWFKIKWLSLAFAGISQPLVVGVGAYLLACLLHTALPEDILHPFGIHAPLFAQRPLYWWPFEGMMLGYTIYPPLDPRFVLSSTGEAACFKLSTLLATLLLYHRSHPQHLYRLPNL